MRNLARRGGSAAAALAAIFPIRDLALPSRREAFCGGAADAERLSPPRRGYPRRPSGYRLDPAAGAARITHATAETGYEPGL